MATSNLNTWTVDEISITNYRHRGYGGFLGEVDVIFPPGVTVPNFHIYVSGGRVRIGAPQDQTHNDLCWFTSPVAFAQFEARVLDLLKIDPGYTASLRQYGVVQASPENWGHYGR